MATCSDTNIKELATLHEIHFFLVKLHPCVVINALPSVRDWSQSTNELAIKIEERVATITPMVIDIAKVQICPEAKTRIPVNEITVVNEVLMDRAKDSLMEMLMLSRKFLLG